MNTKSSEKKRARKRARKTDAMTIAPAGAAQQLTFDCTVKSESATGVGLSIDGHPVPMTQDSDTWSGQVTLIVGDSVQIRFRVKGLDTTAWQTQVDIECPNGPVKLLAKKGTIGQPGGSGFDATANIKADVCN